MKTFRRGALGAALLLRALSGLPAFPSQTPVYAQKFLMEGHRMYSAGRHQDAIAAYLQALRADPGSLEGWLNGGMIWLELGEQDKSAQWFRKAAELAPGDADVLTALSESEFRRGDLPAARAAADKALSIRADHPYALIAKGRVELAEGRTAAAIAALELAARRAPDLTLAHYGLGKARDAAGDLSGAVDAYQRAAFGDSYFTQARYQLVLALMKSDRPHEAWDQVQKLLSTDPNNRDFLHLERVIRPQLSRTPRPPRTRRPPAAPPEEPLPMSPPASGRVPLVRVGLGTDAMGKALARRSVRFFCSTAFSVLEQGSGRVLARGEAKEPWQAYASPGKKGRRIDVRDAHGRIVLRSARTILLRPAVKRGGVLTLHEVAINPGASYPGPDRQIRGDLEVSLLPKRTAIKLVNLIDLESYTHGVLAAEMPVTSPVEALKSQAVVARTHALYIMTMAPRHKKDGYNLCDGQHCQVYSGVRIESGRSRAAVDSTRGRVVTYRGRAAHTLYAANCGGHTQSGREVEGWGDVPYWRSLSDSESPLREPSSPWRLRQWLRSVPPVYCRPSSYIHPSHFRWTRVVPGPEMAARVERTLHIGKLKAILPLRRSISGHLNSVQIRGSKGTRTVTSELKIRGLFGMGSQRSALFILETEYDRDRVPRNFIFYGGGWGHGVGMCQSGAMGRAESGQTYGDILRAYYPGTEIGNLRY